MTHGPAPAGRRARAHPRRGDACLLESGLDARLHAAIAERAGLSRPTLYKYVGDQTAILDAVRDREIEEFFTAAVPLLSSTDDLRDGLVDAVVFVVGYGRAARAAAEGAA